LFTGGSINTIKPQAKAELVDPRSLSEGKRKKRKQQAEKKSRQRDRRRHIALVEQMRLGEVTVC